MSNLSKDVTMYYDGSLIQFYSKNCIKTIKNNSYKKRVIIKKTYLTFLQRQVMYKKDLHNLKDFNSYNYYMKKIFKI